MAWTPALPSDPTLSSTILVATTELYLPDDGTADGLIANAVPIGHNPGEITDLIVWLDYIDAVPSAPIIVSTYTSLQNAPSARGDYSTSPTSRIEYRPPSGDPFGIPFPIGRSFQVLFGFRILSGANTCNVHLEYRQDGVNL